MSFAHSAGFDASSLAGLLGVSEATISRHWNRSDWWRKMEGGNVFAVCSVIPGASEALEDLALRTRLANAVKTIENNGAKVDRTAIDAAVAGGVREHYLATALTAVSHLLAGRTAKAEIALRCCWGREQTRALDVAFGTHGEWSALEDPAQLLPALRLVFAELQKSQSMSLRRCIPLAALAHHIGKATGEIVAHPDGNASSKREWLAAYYIRGAYMGKLRHVDASIELADEYHDIVHEYANAHAAEKWAFPSWVGDIPPSDDFSLSEQVPLPRTAEEILHELGVYNEPYVYYLAKTFIPIALEEMDPSFGGRRDLLADALQKRAAEALNQKVRDQLVTVAGLAKAEYGS